MANLIDRILRREEGSASTATASSSTASSPSNRGAQVAARVTYANGEQSALTVSAFYRALELRANTMSQLVMQYQKRDMAGGNFVEDSYGLGGRLNYLLQSQPNEFINWQTLMKQAEIRRVTRGNAYIYVERDSSGEPTALWLCSDATFNLDSLTYSLTYFMANQAVYETNVPVSDVIHLRNTYSYDGGFTGVPTLTYASRDLNLAATQNELALEAAAKGGRKKLVIQEQAQQSMGLGKVAGKEMEKLKNRVNEEFWNEDVSYIPNAAGITDYSQSLAELELLASRKNSVVDISRYMGVPLVMLNDGSNSNYKTPEAATLEFLSRTIAPNKLEIESEFNRVFVGRDLYGKRRMHLCEKNLFVLDRSGQTDWNKGRLECGIVSINELRAENDLPRIENGDDHYISTNLAIAGSEKLSGSASAE